MPELTSKEICIQKLQEIKDEHIKYNNETREEIVAWQESAKTLLNKIRTWLLPLAALKLLSMKMEEFVFDEGGIDGYLMSKLTITLANNDIVLFKPTVFYTTEKQLMTVKRFLFFNIGKLHGRYPFSWDKVTGWHFTNDQTKPIHEGTFFEFLKVELERNGNAYLGRNEKGD